MSFKIICTGDVMLGENVHHFRRGIVSRFDGKYPSLISENVREQLSTADMLLMNFEASLAKDNQLKKMKIDRAVYVAPVQSLELLKSIKSQVVVSVANNHFGQHGTTSAKESIKILESNGILVTGKNNLPVEIEKNGFRASIYGVSLVKDNHFEGSYFKSSYSDLIADLKLSEKSANEVRIISIHWGEEYLTLENEKQRKLAGDLSAAGFDYIIGHHPHVIQPFSKIGDSSVIYSHGNFIFDQNFSGLTQKGLVSTISIPDGKTELFISQQRRFRVTALKQVSPEQLEKFCKSAYHPKKPVMMRIRMKLELLLKFYELNWPIIQTFTLRMFKK